MNLGFTNPFRRQLSGQQLPSYSGTAYGDFGGVDDYGNAGGLPSYAGEFDSLPADYGAYSGSAPAPSAPKKRKKGLKQGLAAASAMGEMPDITQGMQPVQPFRMTGGLLGGMR